MNGQVIDVKSLTFKRSVEHEKTEWLKATSSKFSGI